LLSKNQIEETRPNILDVKVVQIEVSSVVYIIHKDDFFATLAAAAKSS